jgi:pimeloyl-ACP methyl ester carboxylesterase
MNAAMTVERDYVFAYSRPPDFPVDDSGLLDFLLDPSLTFTEKIGPMVGWFPEYPGLKLLWATCAQMNLPRDVPSVGIPVHILQGEEDHQTETSVARMYFDTLQAPAKTWHLFEGGGHGAPMYDVPRYRRIMEGLRAQPAGPSVEE